MAQSIVSQEVRRSHRQRFFVVDNRVVETRFLQKSVGERNLCIRIIRLDHYGLLAVDDRLIGFAFVEESVAEVVFGIPKVRLHLQG